MKPLFVVVGIKTVSLTNVRWHWARKARVARSQRDQTAAAFIATTGRAEIPLTGEDHLTIRLTRVAPRELDDDNLTGALKHVRDEVAARLAVDDRDKRLTWVYGQRKHLRPNRYEVHVEIRPR